MHTLHIFQNADILTMNDGPVMQHGSLVVRDGKILAVGPGADLAFAEEAAERIDCSGCVILPGLIDSHVHYDCDIMGDFFLAAGVTSVRNMRGLKGHARWRDEILAGKRRGPYIYSSGPIVDGEDPTIPNNTNTILHSKEDVEIAIDFVKRYHFRWMKTYPMIDPDLFEYLLQRCTEEGIPLCGHMTKRMDHAYLADHGYICCEHTSSLPADPEKIRYLARSGMWLCPTHVVCETLPEYVWNGKQLQDLPHYMDLPALVRQEWESKNAIICENYRKLNIHPDFQTIIDRATTFLKDSDRIMAGTDCAYPGIIPGFAMHEELDRLTRVYGMTNYDALAAATSRPAEHIGIASEKGRLLTGMDADLIVVEGNPLRDIHEIVRIRYTHQGEHLYDAEALQQVLAADAQKTPADMEFIPDSTGDVRSLMD